MPAQTDTRDEALRCAREAAHVVLAKHPCVTGGGGKCGKERIGPADHQSMGHQRRICREGQNIVGGQDATGADGS